MSKTGWRVKNSVIRSQNVAESGTLDLKNILRNLITGKKYINFFESTLGLLLGILFSLHVEMPCFTHIIPFLLEHYERLAKSGISIIKGCGA